MEIWKKLKKSKLGKNWKIGNNYDKIWKSWGKIWIFWGKIENLGKNWKLKKNRKLGNIIWKF